jgi:hypothetical protein
MIPIEWTHRNRHGRPRALRPGGVPAIHALLAEAKTWMHQNSGLPEFWHYEKLRKSAIADLLCTRPGMTEKRLHRLDRNPL